MVASTTLKVAPLVGDVLPPEDEVDESGFNIAGRPLCPFCSQPWTARMMHMLDECAIQSGYYGDIEGVDLTIDITCDGCERLIYRKEISVDSSRIGDHWQRR